MIKSCIILSAGLGTRMRPLTNDIPKPMISIRQKPLIGYVMDMVLAAGCNNIVTNIHYKPESLLRYLDQQYHGCVTISDETDMLRDSGGGIVKALEYIENDVFYVINADCIWHGCNALLQMSEQFDTSQMDILKLLYPAQNALGYDEGNIYGLEPNGQIIRHIDNAKYAFTGIQIMQKKLFNASRQTKFSVRSIWDQAYHNEAFYGCVYAGKWLHIGTPQAVKDAEQYFDNVIVA